MEQLQQRLGGHRLEDLSLKREVLAFQAQHLDLSWAELLDAFNNRKASRPPYTSHFEIDFFSDFLLIGGYPQTLDLATYVTTFGHDGLKRITFLNDFEKNVVVDLAKYYLATHYQLLDELGNFKGINLDLITQQLPGKHFTNIARVAANLAGRVRNDIAQYLEAVKEKPNHAPGTNKTNLTYLSASEHGVVFYQADNGLEAWFNDVKVATLPKGKTSKDIIHEAGYHSLPFMVKYDIIQEVSEVIAKERPTDNIEPNPLNQYITVDVDMNHERKQDQELEDDSLQLSSIMMEWTELSHDTNRSFSNLQELQDFLTSHFIRSRQDYDEFIEGGGQYHWYDKTKLHFDFANKSGATYRFTERIDLGYGIHDFNPYLQTIDDYLKTAYKAYFEGYRLSLSHQPKLTLPMHTFSEELVNSLIGKPVPTSFSNIYEAYKFGCQFSDFATFFPTIEGYVAYASKPYPLLEPNIEKERSSLEQVKSELALGQERLVPSERLSEALTKYPVGSQVMSNGQVYHIESVDDEQEYGIRIQLNRPLMNGMITDNPVIYANSLEDFEQRLTPIVEAENGPIEPSTSQLQKESEVANFTFPDDLTDFYPKTPREKIAANLEAIRLVKALTEQNRQASPEEQMILAQYVGWGGLANTFFNSYDTKFKTEREELQTLLTLSEYEGMKESSLTAYYTDPVLIRTMYQKLIDDGFTGGRILDPSMGTGNFFAAMPKAIRDKSELYGVELDPITGAIARQLHPNAHIQIKGFEETNFNDQAFDLVISNIPFANVRIADTRYDKPYVIHDYFIKRSIDLLRDGGQLSIISSTGTMDKRTGNVLKDIESTTQFLGGVRLPDIAFRKIAGTSVTTDILYFQKDDSKLSHPGSPFNTLAFDGAMQLPSDQRVWLNPFFGKGSPDHNPFVLGEFEVKNFNGATLSVKGSSDNLVDDLQEALKQTVPAFAIVGERTVHVERQEQATQVLPPGLTDDMPLYSFAYVGDTIYYRDNTSIRVGSRIEDISLYVDEFGQFQDWADNPSKRLIEQYQELGITDDTALDVYQSDEPAQRGKNKGYYKKTIFFENPLTDKEINRIKGMIDLRDTYQNLINLQRRSGYDQLTFEQLLSQLNQSYDEFVKKYGYLNSPVNRNLFDSDDRYSLLASLEDEYIDDVSQKVAYKKSLAFERPLIRPERVLKEVLTAKDALNSSIAEGRGVDFDFMMSLYKGKTELDIIDELGDEIIPNPLTIDQNPLSYLPRNVFLSGDVVTRLEQVSAKLASRDNQYDWSKYQSMLEAVRPEKITLTDIDYKIGSRWIPDKVYAYFAYSTFVNVPVTSFEDPRLDWLFKTNPIDHRMAYATSSLGYPSGTDIQLGVRNSRHDSGRKIFLNLLNANQATITKKIIDDEGKEKSVTDIEKTAELRAKEAEIQALFKDFIQERPALQEIIEDSYNNLYNRTVTREYDGSHLEIDGLASHITLRPHQKNAIQRIVEEKRALLAHEVGSGKTLTMLGAGFKMKELGMVNKPLYVVPSGLTAQFGQEIMKFFPTKNVFVTTKKDFIKANRKQFISRIITGDYDAIVIGDSQFEKIPMSKENQQVYLRDKLNELREIKESTSDNNTVKQIEASIKGFKEQLQKLQELDQDSFIEFENLGIDCLFVDEAHHFKNIRPVTNLGNVAGITNKTSKKNIDMEMKVRQIQSEHHHQGIIFATGTPVSNSISEMFTMMNYVQPDVLAHYKVDRFDAWVGAFGQIENTMELSPTGDKYQPKKRFKKFTNLPELMKLYKETADIQTSDMLELPVPEVKIIPVESELTDTQRDYLADLVERSDLVKSGQVDPTEDNMLKITSEARKLAIDMRLIDGSYDLSDNNKLLQVVDNVERIYYEGGDNKVTQMIFSDIGTPKTKTNQGSFDVYNELRNLLIERGIPAQEIAFVHDANTDEKKNTLSRKVNAGDVRILLASTEKGGTGLNVQRKMKAVHHLDVPWRPSDLTQRNGRLIRQGNENKGVEVYHYITKGSFDNFLWETQEKKLKYITQIMTSTDPVRSAEDIDEQTMTASDFKALATGNPYLRQKMELENKLNLMENQLRAFHRNQDNARSTLNTVSEKLPALEAKLSRFEADKLKSEGSKNQEFCITLAGQIIDKKKEAGEQLHTLLENNVSANKELRTLGSYRGFELKALTQESKPAVYDFGDLLVKPTYTLQVVGANQYPVTLDLESGVGTMRRIDNVIDNIIKEEEKTTNLINNYKAHVLAARETLSKTFPMSDYQEVKEKYELLAPLIEQGESVEVIEDAIRTYLDKKAEQKQEAITLDLD